MASRSTTASRSARAAALGAGLVLAVAGCTGGDGSDPEPSLTTETSGGSTTDAPTDGSSPAVPDVEGLGDVCERLDAAQVALLVPDVPADVATEASTGEVLESCTYDNGLPAEQQQVLVVSVTTSAFFDADAPATQLQATCGAAEVVAGADGAVRCEVPVEADAAEAHGALGDRLVSARFQNGLAAGVSPEQTAALAALVDELLLA